MYSKNPLSTQARILAACLVLSPLPAGLAACSDPAVETAAETPAPAATTAANPNIDLVQAASVGTANAPVRAAFELLGTPVAGTELQIRVVLTTTAEVDQVQASLEAPDDIELTDESVFFQVGKSGAGQRHEHKFGLRLKAPGVALLTATVTVDKDDISTVSQFAMPIIVAAHP